MTLDTRKILYFVAGILPTAEEIALIARLRGNVQVRSNGGDPTYAGRLEEADCLAGTIPESYLTGDGDTIDTSLYPGGDVTPTLSASPEDFNVLPAALTIKVGETMALAAVSADLNESTGAIVLTDKAAAVTVDWESSDEAKATVDTNGVVTAVATGSATITASYTPADGEDPIESTCAITVSAATAVAVLVLPATISVAALATAPLYSAETKSDGTVTNVTATSASWSSGTPSVASVDAATGVVTGVLAGSSVITFTKGGHTSTCTVTVPA